MFIFVTFTYSFASLSWKVILIHSQEFSTFHSSCFHFLMCLTFNQSNKQNQKCPHSQLFNHIYLSLTCLANFSQFLEKGKRFFPACSHLLSINDAWLPKNCSTLTAYFLTLSNTNVKHMIMISALTRKAKRFRAGDGHI